ncbi:MAG TPA: PIN domain-containing protein [Nitrospirae bacterium]|nr:PIN domain-containing protein [Nitrospirota bacterium]
MARKLKLYLDTSVPNAYVDDKNPVRQGVTKDFWARLDRYNIFTSELVVEEIEATGNINKKNQLLDLIKGFEKLSIKGKETEALAEEYVKRGIIPVKHIEDAVHIAVATVYSLDVLVSWNFEHIVKLKTKREINVVNILLGYNQLEIVEPTML